LAFAISANSFSIETAGRCLALADLLGGQVQVFFAGTPRPPATPLRLDPAAPFSEQILASLIICPP
jgi:hypothetical protein